MDSIDEANIGRKGFANRLTHILYHLQDHKENIKAIMYGETEKVLQQKPARQLSDLALKQLVFIKFRFAADQRI